LLPLNLSKHNLGQAKEERNHGKQKEDLST
jgi:hypothetical protein